MRPTGIGACVEVVVKLARSFGVKGNATKMTKADWR